MLRQLNLIACSLVITCATLTADVSPRHQDYLKLLSEYPKALGPWGDASKGEIEILLDPLQLEIIEKENGREVGIVRKDRYWMWLNDAVKFPNGKCGIYGRILWIKALDGIAGVAVMPILPDGRIVLNRNYRHATRTWEYELPRGMLEKGESVQAGAIREVQEETGMIVNQCIFLGNIAPDSGLTANVVPIYMARVTDQTEANPEFSEAIAAIEAFTLDELKQAYIKGYITVTIGSTKTDIPLRDPFLAFALFQANIRNLINL